jgi:hypothetical protein
MKLALLLKIFYSVEHKGGGKNDDKDVFQELN